MRWPVCLLLKRHLLSGKTAEEARKDEAGLTVWRRIALLVGPAIPFFLIRLGGAPSSRLIEELPLVRFDVL